MDYLYLILGLILLAVSSNFLVDSSVSLARHLKVSTLIIGIVIVSIGTSSPELVVSIIAALKGQADISLGNVIGSNIANIALILGFTSIILPISLKNHRIWIDWLIMIFASLLLYFILFINNELNVIWGFVFIIILSLYILYLFINARKSNSKDVEVNVLKPKFSLLISLIIFVVSCLGLYFGADFLINSAVNIAKSFNISERIISLTVIAFGTSIPELSASLVAAIKKETDISIGNIIGSNLFNILGILGVTSIVSFNKPIVPKEGFFVDIYWMLTISVLLLIPILLKKVNRISAIVFFLIYIIYVYLLINPPA
ncbi:MAG: calcium/sodium antiporter [Marinilabiliales bacterium]